MSTESSLTAPRQGMNLRRFVDDWAMLMAALGIFVLCALLIDNFMSPLNMRGLGLAISTVGIAACTMLYCLASGHFDLSVGSVLACSGVIAGIVIRDTDSVFLGVSAALAMGLGPEAFWRLSLREWRMLTVAAAGQGVIGRSVLDRMAEAWPDE